MNQSEVWSYSMCRILKIDSTRLVSDRLLLRPNASWDMYSFTTMIGMSAPSLRKKSSYSNTSKILIGSRSFTWALLLVAELLTSSYAISIYCVEDPGFLVLHWWAIICISGWTEADNSKISSQRGTQPTQDLYRALRAFMHIHVH